MEQNCRIQLFTYVDDYFNVHHSVSENYEDPFTKLHMHTVYELYLFLDGEGEFNVSGNTYALEPGMILLMRPGEPHSLKVAHHKRYERIALHFDGAFFETNPSFFGILKMFSQIELGMINCFINSREKEFRIKLFKQMTNPAITDPKKQLAAICANLPALLFNIGNNFSENELGHIAFSDTIVRRIIKYIDNNLYNKWSLDDLAKQLYHDKAYLNRKFKRSLGSGIWDYTIRKRIIGIKQQMHTFSNVNEAFKASGFGDYSSFFRNYVKITGNTPSDDIKKAFQGNKMFTN